VSAQVPNSDGLSTLFSGIRPALLRFLLSRSASQEEAEDILQDVHLKLLGEATGPIGQPRAYLYKMVNNHFLVHRRTAGRRSRREEDWVGAHGSGSEMDDQPSIETELVARQQVAILQRVLDDMPERTRTIFRRFRVDGEPQRTIAADLGITISAVEKHLAKAYKEISAARLQLDEDMPDRRSLTGDRGRYAT
jgi:RNA polymerase sigma factor (sigma-70 family)